MKQTPREKVLDSINSGLSYDEITKILRKIDRKDYQIEAIKKLLETNEFTSKQMQNIRDHFNTAKRFDNSLIKILNNDNTISLNNLKAILDTITFIQMDSKIVNFTFPILKQKKITKEIIKDFISKKHNSIILPEKLFQTLVKFGIVDESFRTDMYEIFDDESLLPNEVKDIFLF